MTTDELIKALRECPAQRLFWIETTLANPH